MGATKRSAVYLRHTPEERADAMLNACIIEAKSRKWHVDEGADVFEDVDGTRDGLAHLRKMLDGYTAVIAYDLKHFTRGPREFLDFVNEAIERNVRVVSVQDELDTGHKTGRWFLRQLESLTEAQSEHTSRAVSLRQRERVEAGQWRGGSTPFGWAVPEEASPVALVLDDDEATLLREAVDRVIAGETVSAIVKDWNARGVKTRRGGRWRDTTLRRALRRPYLRGYLPEDGDVQRDERGRPVQAVEPLISEREAKRLAKSLGEVKTQARSSDTTLLAGLAYCAHCGSKMYGRNADDPSAVYFCSKRSDEEGRCPGVAISMFHLEEYVAEFVKAYLSPELLKRLPKGGNQTLDRDIHAVRDAMATLQRDRYERGLYEGREGAKAFQREWERLAEALTELKQRRYVMTELEVSPPLGLNGDLRRTWDKLTTAEQRDIVEAVIERVEVQKGQRGQPFDADRVNIVPKVA